MIQKNSEIAIFTSGCQRYKFTVKVEFLKKCHKPDTYEPYELMNIYHINRYLHSNVGPAIVDLVTGNEEYWINGEQLTKENSEKLKHKNEFDKKFMDMLEEE